MSGVEAGASAQGAAMDRMYRLTRHVYDVTRKPYLLGRDRMLRDLAVPPGGTVLELACGTGRNLIRLAQAHPGARCFGTDISNAMLQTAARSVRRAGLGERIRLAPGDATAFDAEAAFGVVAFDRVYVSYALSMIPDWEAALAEALRLVKPGGRLGIVDFGDGAHLPAPLRAALHGWLGLFHVTPRAAFSAKAIRLDAERVTLTYGVGNYWQMALVER